MIGDPSNSTSADAAPVACKNSHLKLPHEERSHTIADISDT